MSIRMALLLYYLFIFGLTINIAQSWFDMADDSFRQPVMSFRSLGPSARAAYEAAIIKEKLREAMATLEKNGIEVESTSPITFKQQDAPRTTFNDGAPRKQLGYDSRRSAITKYQLNRLIKAMRTRMFGSAR